MDIKALRARLGLTRAQLAGRLRVDRTTVWRWEAGEVEPQGPAVVLLEQLAREAQQKDAAA